METTKFVKVYKLEFIYIILCTYNYNILFDVALYIGTLNKLLLPFLSTYGHYILYMHYTKVGMYIPTFVKKY